MSELKVQQDDVLIRKLGEKQTNLSFPSFYVSNHLQAKLDSIL